MASFDIKANDILLVIDVQNDFSDGGALAVPDGDAVVPSINELMQRFSHIALTQDWHPPGHSSFASSQNEAEPFSTIEMPYGKQTLWPDHCIQGSSGANFHDALVTSSADVIIRKGYRKSIDSYSAFYENDRSTPTGLNGYLKERGIERVFCCGLATDFCVRFSAEDACACGYETFVIEQACRGIDMDGSVDAALAAVQAAGAVIV